MTDKVQKIREEVERLKSNLIYGACASQVVMETYCKEEAYNEVLAILDTMQEELVNNDLEEAAKKYAKEYLFTAAPTRSLTDHFKAGAKWQKERDQSTIELAEDHAYFAGSENTREKLVDKACEWLSQTDFCHYYNKEFIDNFRKAMEE